jgi:hypothetical protein
LEVFLDTNVARTYYRCASMPCHMSECECCVKHVPSKEIHFFFVLLFILYYLPEVYFFIGSESFFVIFVFLFLEFPSLKKFNIFSIKII